MSPESEEGALEDVRARVQAQIGDGPPRKQYACDGVVKMVALLAERGQLSTGEPKEELYAGELGEHYSNKRTMWNSIDRRLEEFDGVSKPGYGEWAVDVGGL